MQIPEGYALVKISEVPERIRSALETVLRHHQIDFCYGRSWHSNLGPVLAGVEHTKLMIEIGNNVAATVVAADHSEEF